MKTKRYKTLKGLMKALNTSQLSVLDMNRGQAWFRSEEKTCKFELPEKVREEFYMGCAKVVWRNPKDWQAQRLQHYNAGIMGRLWFNGKRYEYCAGQDYPGEIRFIQNKINHLY